ncbi:MAG TPA: leucyl/phenylalanyl-tRNA--protein transferase [Dissulfurispiraceae bacterium]|nr:leucyl/phenylalanyl-tRNA--protein transferase [Dissulfurispiraceae bacterium]
MAVFRLTDDLTFPPPELAEKSGLLAVGGDLSTDRLVLAYSMGIFPWYSDGYPILWWSPDPRLVLLPEELQISRSLRQAIKKGIYKITIDKAFDRVIRECSEIPRKHEDGTWITHDMIVAYMGLHSAGYAHSVEAWLGDELAGGLYGVLLGRAFFGESMFARKSNASKVAFALLVRQLGEGGIELIDCQVTTSHLKQFGAREMPRSEFLKRLEKATGKLLQDRTAMRP